MAPMKGSSLAAAVGQGGRIYHFKGGQIPREGGDGHA
jgi:hypothetical protein